MSYPVKSTFLIQATATDVPGQSPAGAVTKYFAVDHSSGGYPWFPEHWTSAQHFESYEKAMKVIKAIIEEKPTVYNSSKGEAFSQHAIPSTLRRVAGGQVDNDGYYRFVFHIIEIKGNTLLTSEIIKRYNLIVEGHQYHNTPNKPPVLKHFKFEFSSVETEEEKELKDGIS